MISNQKYRINTMAKDFNIKSKDLLDMLTSCGIDSKNNHMAQLEPREFSLLFDMLTKQNQTVNMKAYLEGKADIPADKKPVREKPKKVKPAEPKEPEKPAEAAQQAAESAKKPAQQDVASKPKTAEAKQPVQQKTVVKPEIKTVHGASKSQDRFVRPSSNQVHQKSKIDPRQKNAGRDRQQRTIIPSSSSPVKGTVEIGGANSSPVRATRIVDTRANTVDLSKYDEKLDKYVQENARERAAEARQKMRRQQNRSQSGKDREKDRQAMERMRRDQEKAKKAPLRVSVPDSITVGDLAVKLKITAGDLIKRLLKLGVMASVNEVVDFDTAYLVADEMGAIVTREVVVSIEEKLFTEEEDKPEDLEGRSPVVCVMGHVDHGKTSLLDAIRHSNVTAGEAGGITQHIGAYRVRVGDRDITFLDTPGHEAFTAMRARGAQATDIAILVVAADDGIMPQTVEAINHAKAAKVKIVVAINKIDKPGASPETVMNELTKYDLVPEAWGGDTICCPVSAITKQGIDELLENVVLLSDIMELKANPRRRAKGIVIESRLDKGKGPIASVLVQNGTLHSGDVVIAGTSVGRVRAMTNENGRTLKEAGPSVPVEIIGLDSVPSAGDEFNAVEDEKMARTLAEQRITATKEETFKSNAKTNLEDLFANIEEGRKDLNIIVKADVVGSAEAVKASLEKLTCDEVKVNVIHAAAGSINEGDIMFASASDAIIIGFNIRPDKQIADTAAKEGIDIRTYRIIYECIEEVEAAIKGMLKPVYKETVLGHAEVRQTIHVPKVGTIAGSYVLDGKITRTSLIRVLRESVVIFEDRISSLKRFKDDVREVAQGYECGVGLEKFNDIKERDILEAYIMEQIQN